MATNFWTSYNPEADLNRSTTTTFVNITQKNNTPKSENSCISIIVQFSPEFTYFINKLTVPDNSALFDIKIVNSSEKAVEVKITKIEFIEITKNKVLVSLLPQELHRLGEGNLKISRDYKFLVQPNSYEVLGYQWTSESNIFEPGQRAIAIVHYRVNGQAETSVQSSPAEPSILEIREISSSEKY